MMKSRKSVLTFAAIATMVFAPSLVQAQSSAEIGTAVSPAPAGYKPPPVPGIKDFQAARELELGRTKFHQAQLEKQQKCLEGAKNGTELTACVTEYRKALAANLAKLVQQGKLAAAYDIGQSTRAPATPVSPKK